MRARHVQVLQDQIRHGFFTRQQYHVPGGARRGVPRAASEILARQDRVRLRALCAGLRALLAPGPECEACAEQDRIRAEIPWGAR